jgi:hypothetical protein
MNKVTRWLVFGGLPVLLGLYAVGHLHRQGYCFSQSRFINDDEVLLAAVFGNYLGQTREGMFRNPEIIAETTKKLAENPDCCRLLSGAEEDEYLEDYYDILDRFFGYASRVVLIRGEPESDPQYKITRVVPISSCGLRDASIRRDYEKISNSTTN